MPPTAPSPTEQDLPRARLRCKARAAGDGAFRRWVYTLAPEALAPDYPGDGLDDGELLDR